MNLDEGISIISTRSTNVDERVEIPETPLPVNAYSPHARSEELGMKRFTLHPCSVHLRIMKAPLRVKILQGCIQTRLKQGNNTYSRDSESASRSSRCYTQWDGSSSCYRALARKSH